MAHLKLPPDAERRSTVAHVDDRPPRHHLVGVQALRFLSTSIITTAAIVASAPAAAQSTTLTATFSKGGVAEYSNNPNGTDNGVLFSSLNITSLSISQPSATGVWGGSQGNDVAVTAKITFTNGTTTTFPAAIN